MASLAAAVQARRSFDCADAEAARFESRRLHRLPSKRSVNLPLACTICIGSISLLVGLSFLLSAFTNSRVVDVENYDQEVRHWQDVDRPQFAQLQIDLVAKLPPSEGGGGVTEVRANLLPTEEDDWRFADAEGARGVEEYEPLSYRLNVDLPCYYNNCSMVRGNALGQLSPRTAWDYEIPPSWDEAPRAEFAFTVAGAGAESSFAISPLPLLYDFPTVGQAPQPRAHCYGTSRGVYKRPGACHHAHKLMDLCLAIGFDSSGWKLHHFEIAPSPWNNTKRTGTYGCDPQKGYEPATYHKDPCWGPTPNRRLCDEAGANHTLRVTVRAWHDPYILAAQLTRGTFDFGLSTATQVKVGSVMLTLGVIATFCPCFLRRNCPVRDKQKSEEREVLSPQAQKFGFA